MPVKNEKYDQLKIDRLKKYLEDMASKSQPKFYEIFVDGLKAVPKTDNPADFDGYELYMNEDTEKVRILIYYTANTPRNDQYCFHVQQAGLNGMNGLHGLGNINQIIQEKLDAQKEQLEKEKLVQELEEAKTKLQESEDYAEMLEGQLEQFKSQKFKLGNINLGELASVAMESMMRRNVHLLTKIPGGAALAGIIDEDTKEKEKQLLNPGAVQPPEEVAATFQPKAEPQLSQEQQGVFEFLQQLNSHFNQQELEKLMHIIQVFAEEKKHLQTVAELLNIKSEPQ
jgi:hypothetical protein